MNIQSLEYFVKIAECLNISKAAKQLFVSQSRLSQCLSDLEEELNVVLISRTTQKRELTQAGQVFLKEAQHVLREYNKLFTLFPSEKALDHSMPIGYYASIGDMRR